MLNPVPNREFLHRENQMGWHIVLQYNLLTNSWAPELESSSPYLQETAIGPYPEPTGSALYLPWCVTVQHSQTQLTFFVSFH
jgi:hypothetical protein